MTLSPTYTNLLFTLIILGFSGCTPTLSTNPEFTSNTTSTDTPNHTSKDFQAPSPEKEEKFKRTMHSVGLNIQNDPAYQRIDFAGKEEKKWFRMLTYRLWDRQITRQQFLLEGRAKYPQHIYEFEFIIAQLSACHKAEDL